MSPQEQDEFARRVARALLEQGDLAEHIAQIVVLRLAERERINALADMVIEQIEALDGEEDAVEADSTTSSTFATAPISRELIPDRNGVAKLGITADS